MPRRPRPVSRRPPKNSVSAHGNLKPRSLSPEPVAKLKSRVEGPSAPSSEEGEGQEDHPGVIGEGGEDGEEVDAPRMSQWVDDDDDFYEQVNDEPRPVEEDLASLPFGVLAKAKRELDRQETDERRGSGLSSSGPSEASSSEDEEDRPGAPARTGKTKEQMKRANKHAPVEMSSKRAVSRKRQVVEVKTHVTRDPRFGGDVSGEFSAFHFSKNYEFITKYRENEFQTLKDHLKQARKLLASSPAHMRAERQAEVDKLGRTFKRTETLLQNQQRAELERSTLTKLKKEEQAKRLSGKGAWFMNDGEKKRAVLKARFEGMGKGEARKAMERRQKRIAQKEKKARPWAKGETQALAGMKRKGSELELTGEERKRRRVG